MMKKILLSVALLGFGWGFVSCKSADTASATPGAQAYVLDKPNSSLQATVTKNESVPVVLKFPQLDGNLALSPLVANLTISIDSLDTGNKDRDTNVKTLFFEVASAMNQKAGFALTHLDVDASELKEGQSKEAKGEGTLNLHGAKANLSGPLTLSRSATGYSATFKDSWILNIKDAGMAAQLANLNRACPQPHRVGLDVKLAGNLVFVKR
jgi:polyisoprenoid-binding protein YceI